MILQSLYNYYERKTKLGEIAPVGFEWKGIPFLIVIDMDGNLKGLKDTREKVEKRLVAKFFLVPQAVGRSGSGSWKKTNLLWDHYGYVLRYPKGDAVKDRKKRNELLQNIKTENEFLLQWQKSEKLLTQVTITELDALVTALSEESDQKDAQTLLKNIQGLIKAFSDSEKQFGTFINSINELPEKIREEPEIKSILQFYQKKEYIRVPAFENWMDCAGINGANISFQIEGENRLILSNNAITKYQAERVILPNSKEEKKGLCLITGNQDYIERLHDSTPLSGGQATGKLVGFQKNSGFDSYGKEQAFNAPVGRYAQKAYATALNTLTKNQNNRVVLGDTTVIFWAEEPSIVEKTMAFVLTKPKDDPDRGIQAVKQLYQSYQSGKIASEEAKRFYVLGLAPNAARIAVRYWLTGPVAEFARHITQHFDDLEIIRDKDVPEFFALSSMLSHTALDYKISNVAPNVAGQVTEAVLKGTPYPQTLFYSVIRRIRAEQGKKINERLVPNVTRIRAAIIKACINRFNRFYHKKEEEIKVSLDKTNKNPAYLLGRLFAVLEKVQWKALGIETIRERFYGAFSSTPVTVYPQLMKLKNHHLAKMDSGKNFFENLIGEIIDGLDGSGIIPRQFSLEEQGRFAVGYYHQRQDLKYKEKKTENNIDKSEESTHE
ncbi:MAG: type I-C CRISPR-associated protein Cas8c/Csd1 [Desulfotignum sp.]|nr:type I-C CRISPR-associated protein Cas8c/Csd1 [Desulfotignum sp.]MCF8086788.1 type I-C CRISPR-associated protein Cas8c/Csd1 [Desulfotignum sp.]MCF8136738.1 type I-C CRISPR-associated protein Cas8c/Csd1 [Desulfotignum sp.]